MTLALPPGIGFVPAHRFPMDQPRAQLSPARRRARIVVWAALGVVLLFRVAVFPPGPEESWLPRFSFERQPRFQPPQQRRHRPTPTPPARSEVPADFPRLQIEIAAKDVTTLRGYVWNGWRGETQERPEILATVREGGKVYPRVALHLKGSAGSFRPFDDKPALTLNFAKHEPGRRFHGYTKISLNNSVQDATYLSEAICRELVQAAGIPVPRVSHATVLINGADKGLYVLAEGYNKDFLRRHFKKPDGNLYDGGFVRDVRPDMALNAGDAAPDRAKINELISAANLRDPAERWDRLGRVLDVDRFVTLLALEVLMCNWDGYSMNRNNYRIYDDPESGRLIFMPHGMDQMFDSPPGRFPVDGPILVPMRGLVAEAVITSPPGQAKFLARLGQLATNQFDARTITNRVHELAGQLVPTLAAYSPEMVRQHAHNVATFCDHIGRRFQSVADQLSAPPGPPVFDAQGVARLERWRPRLGLGNPDAQLERGEAGGHPILRVTLRDRRASPSWRSWVFLEPGRYRFEARVRAAEGEGGEGGRARIRISGWRSAEAPLQGAEWLPLACPFEVAGPAAQLQFVCEYIGPPGEAWFDLDSLRLVRLGRER